ncbi:type II secretion system F family protein [Oceanotoga sp. DSM 15011]|uniref:type II secretion system F family protein n=1 Tax=Oceanotoga sp. DSM 15011 TaxID=2984951 RepID=UPI0021F44724|nr:type II secretion system F family protein [Oceanotoga sp. DSM 15011]UYO98992.1 type II secretion system F family protein [Oceanotoga sp. DSM 15011]
MKYLFLINYFDKILKKEIEVYVVSKRLEDIYDLMNIEEFEIKNIKKVGYYMENKKLNMKNMQFISENFYMMMSSDIKILDILSFLTFNEDIDKFIRGIISKSYFMIRKGFEFNESFNFFEYDEYFRYSMSYCDTYKMILNTFNNMKNYYKSVRISADEIKKSTFYPSSVLITILFVLLLLKFYIIPTFSNYMDINFSFFIPTFLIFLISFLVVFIFIAIFFAKKNDLIVMNMPLIRKFYRNYIFYKFSRDVFLLISNRFTIYNAFDKVLQYINSNYIFENFFKVSVELEKGKELSEILFDNKHYQEFTFMFSVSDKTGNYLEVFSFLSTYFYENLKRTLNRINKMVEPILILILGIIVFSIAFELFDKVYIGGIDSYEF